LAPFSLLAIGHIPDQLPDGYTALSYEPQHEWGTVVALRKKLSSERAVSDARFVSEIVVDPFDQHGTAEGISLQDALNWMDSAAPALWWEADWSPNPNLDPAEIVTGKTSSCVVDPSFDERQILFLRWFLSSLLTQRPLVVVHDELGTPRPLLDAMLRVLPPSLVRQVGVTTYHSQPDLSPFKLSFAWSPAAILKPGLRPDMDFLDLDSAPLATPVDDVLGSEEVKLLLTGAARAATGVQDVRGLGDYLRASTLLSPSGWARPRRGGSPPRSVDMDTTDWLTQDGVSRLGEPASRVPQPFGTPPLSSAVAAERRPRPDHLLGGPTGLNGTAEDVTVPVAPPPPRSAAVPLSPVAEQLSSTRDQRTGDAQTSLRTRTGGRSRSRLALGLVAALIGLAFGFFLGRLTDAPEPNVPVCTPTDASPSPSVASPSPSSEPTAGPPLASTASSPSTRATAPPEPEVNPAESAGAPDVPASGRPLVAGGITPG
jgi:hypothetical protein